MSTALPSYDTRGAIIYIIGVLAWYAIGFGLLLVGNINPRIRRMKRHEYKNIYEAVNDLDEQKARNDILNELKDKDRRKKLWAIYFSSTSNTPITPQTN